MLSDSWQTTKQSSRLPAASLSRAATEHPPVFLSLAHTSHTSGGYMNFSKEALGVSVLSAPSFSVCSSVCAAGGMPFG